MSASGSDRAIAAVMQWAARAEWRGWLEDVIADHLAPACLAAGVAPDEWARRNAGTSCLV